jgi:hypothetical protein
LRPALLYRNTDASRSASYALLCNIYASSGNWNEFARLKKDMRSSGVQKSPGKSWIKPRGALKVFIADDRSHPESDEIEMYTMLGLIGLEMVKADYIPELSCHSCKYVSADHTYYDLLSEEMLAKYG